MNITYVEVKYFRCLTSFSATINNSLVLIVGSNGVGKSSLIEALHYSCYLRSFRTHIPYDLITFNQEAFSVKLVLEEVQENYHLHVGCTGKKRSVKVNQKQVASFKELLQYYRVITITEDDMLLVRGNPEVRRTFIDQAIALQNSNYQPLLRKYNTILSHRNALLVSTTIQQTSYDLWTHQLWQHAQIIAKERIALLQKLQEYTNQLLQQWISPELSVHFLYQPKRCKVDQLFEDFIKEQPSLYMIEQQLGRSIFGIHLDDITINFCHKASRSFASRGQQKLLVLLIKIAQIQLMHIQQNSVIVLLDDFMNDLDSVRSKLLLELLMTIGCQVIFTSPTRAGQFEQQLIVQGAQVIDLDSLKQ